VLHLELVVDGLEFLADAAPGPVHEFSGGRVINGNDLIEALAGQEHLLHPRGVGGVLVEGADDDDCLGGVALDLGRVAVEGEEADARVSLEGVEPLQLVLKGVGGEFGARKVFVERGRPLKHAVPWTFGVPKLPMGENGRVAGGGEVSYVLLRARGRENDPDDVLVDGLGGSGADSDGRDGTAVRLCVDLRASRKEDAGVVDAGKGQELGVAGESRHGDAADGYGLCVRRQRKGADPLGGLSDLGGGGLGRRDRHGRGAARVG
jgi:hypothetical protein